MIYRSKQGDVLDAICQKHYGDVPYSVEEVYAINTGLALLGPVLPSGVVIELPEPSDVQTTPATLRLWD